MSTADKLHAIADEHAAAFRQLKETVDQDLEGVTVRSATITCVCGVERALVLTYKCLYCKTWLCHQCAEEHFGKTVAQYETEQAAQLARGE